MIDSHLRYRVVSGLYNVTKEWEFSRNMESCLFSFASDHYDDYIDKSQQILYNLMITPALKDMECKKMVSLESEGLSKGTIMYKFQEQQKVLAERCKKNLSESIESMSNSSSLISCRKCLSTHISWEQKQTRGADEAMTIFCTCNTCKSRWKM